MLNVEPGEGRSSSGAVDESDGGRGRGGEEREGKGDPALDDALDDDLEDDLEDDLDDDLQERESKGELALAFQDALGHQ